MGKIREYRCACGYEMRFFEGAGIQGCSTSAIERFFSEAAKKFLAEREQQQIEHFLLDSALAQCDTCKTLKTVARFSYKRKNETEAVCVVKDVCKECKNGLRILDDIENVHCPKCGADMNYSIEGNWD